MATKQKRPRHTTPPGIAKFPHLVTPDTKFKADGEFHCKLRYTDEAAIEALKKVIDPAVEASYQQALTDRPKYKKLTQRAYPYTEELDEDGNETGAIVFNFKQNAKIKKRDGTVIEVKIPLFDAKGSPITGKPSIWGGSELIVAYTIRPYFMESEKKAGVTLDLAAVQVIKMVSGGGGDASSFGFGKRDGYEADDEDELGGDADDNGFSDQSGGDASGDAEPTNGDF